VTTLFETPAEPKPPWWLGHTDDIDKIAKPHTDLLTCLPDHICPWCMEDIGSVFCCGQSTHIEMKGNTG
jgi:hypothetical protein